MPSRPLYDTKPHECASEAEPICMSHQKGLCHGGDESQTVGRLKMAAWLRGKQWSRCLLTVCVSSACAGRRRCLYLTHKMSETRYEPADFSFPLTGLRPPSHLVSTCVLSDGTAAAAVEQQHIKHKTWLLLYFQPCCREINERHISIFKGVRICPRHPDF